VRHFVETLELDVILLATLEVAMHARSQHTFPRRDTEHWVKTVFVDALTFRKRLRVRDSTNGATKKKKQKKKKKPQPLATNGFVYQSSQNPAAPMVLKIETHNAENIRKSILSLSPHIKIH
jgi:hypothetical protein